MRFPYITLLVISLVIFAQADVQTDLTFIRICNQTSPISLETMNKVLINKQLDENKSSNFKCFLHCLFTKYGWMDEDGGFLLHEIKRMLDEVQVEVASLEYVLFKCTAIDSVDKCERSFLFTQCFWNKAIQKETVEDQLLYHVEDKK